MSCGKQLLQLVTIHDMNNCSTLPNFSACCKPINTRKGNGAKFELWLCCDFTVVCMNSCLVLNTITSINRCLLCQVQPCRCSHWNLFALGSFQLWVLSANDILAGISEYIGLFVCLFDWAVCLTATWFALFLHPFRCSQSTDLTVSRLVVSYSFHRWFCLVRVLGSVISFGWLDALLCVSHTSDSEPSLVMMSCPLCLCPLINICCSRIWAIFVWLQYQIAHNREWVSKGVCVSP